MVIIKWIIIFYAALYLPILLDILVYNYRMGQTGEYLCKNIQNRNNSYYNNNYSNNDSEQSWDDYWESSSTNDSDYADTSASSDSYYYDDMSVYRDYDPHL